MKRKNFNLVELLIVVSIIAILVGILLPALKSARDKSRQISCTNNLRQIGNARIMYSGDYDDWIVPVNGYDATAAGVTIIKPSWYSLLGGFQSYGKSSPVYGVLFWRQYVASGSPSDRGNFLCPSESLPSRHEDMRETHYLMSGIGGISQRVSGTYGSFFHKNNAVTLPSECIFAGDNITKACKTPFHIFHFAYRHAGNDPVSDARLNDESLNKRGKTNIAYMDGHVNSVSLFKLLSTPDNTGGTSKTSALYRGYIFGKGKAVPAP